MKHYLSIDLGADSGRNVSVKFVFPIKYNYI